MSTTPIWKWRYGGQNLCSIALQYDRNFDLRISTSVSPYLLHRPPSIISLPAFVASAATISPWISIPELHKCTSASLTCLGVLTPSSSSFLVPRCCLMAAPTALPTQAALRPLSPHRKMIPHLLPLSHRVMITLLSHLSGAVHHETPWTVCLRN